MITDTDMVRTVAIVALFCAAGAITQLHNRVNRLERRISRLRGFHRAIASDKSKISSEMMKIISQAAILYDEEQERKT